ncbi:TPA: hypothetical protein ACGBG5_003603 [Enterococcus faecalis]
MGLFFSSYRVEYKEKGLLFNDWVTVISNISLDEANKYVKDQTSGLFSESPSSYRIVKE